MHLLSAISSYLLSAPRLSDGKFENYLSAQIVVSTDQTQVHLQKVPLQILWLAQKVGGQSGPCLCLCKICPIKKATSLLFWRLKFYLHFNSK